MEEKQKTSKVVNVVMGMKRYGDAIPKLRLMQEDGYKWKESDDLVVLRKGDFEARAMRTLSINIHRGRIEWIGQDDESYPVDDDDLWVHPDDVILSSVVNSTWTQGGE